MQKTIENASCIIFAKIVCHYHILLKTILVCRWQAKFYPPRRAAAAATHEVHLMHCGGSCIAAAAVGIEVPQYKPFYTVPFFSIKLTRENVVKANFF